MKIVARTSKFFIGLVALALSPVIGRAVLHPTPFTFLWAGLAIAVVVRVAKLHVGVTKDFVRIQNFFKTTEVPIWEAEIEHGEPEPGFALSDAGGRYDEGGRMLYVVRSWHQDRVHIGVAPRFGDESIRIHDDLVVEIQKARAA